jgi:hypothetical protein
MATEETEEQPEGRRKRGWVRTLVLLVAVAVVANHLHLWGGTETPKAPEKSLTSQAQPGHAGTDPTQGEAPTEKRCVVNGLGIKMCGDEVVAWCKIQQEETTKLRDAAHGTAPDYLGDDAALHELYERTTSTAQSTIDACNSVGVDIT